MMDNLRFLIELERAEDDFVRTGDEIAYRADLKALGFKGNEIDEEIERIRA